MNIKRTLSIILGIAGVGLTLTSIPHARITGAVIGTNVTSRYIGLIGIVLMILAVIIERMEIKKHLRK